MTAADRLARLLARCRAEGVAVVDAPGEWLDSVATQANPGGARLGKRHISWDNRATPSRVNDLGAWSHRSSNPTEGRSDMLPNSSPIRPRFDAEA